MAIYDVFTFSGEKEILDIRLNILKDYVDGFIIVECPISFSGKIKPLYFPELQDKYKEFPISYFVIDNLDDEYDLEEEEKETSNDGPTLDNHIKSEQVANWIVENELNTCIQALLNLRNLHKQS